jgi:hypothetical protein
MGRYRRGLRDGTGPRRGSYQEQNVGVGRRQQVGEPCPAEKTAESKHGSFYDRRSKL